MWKAWGQVDKFLVNASADIRNGSLYIPRKGYAISGFYGKKRASVEMADRIMEHAVRTNRGLQYGLVMSDTSKTGLFQVCYKHMDKPDMELITLGALDLVLRTDPSHLIALEIPNNERVIDSMMKLFRLVHNVTGWVS